jgi:hypothetical protein
MPVIAMPADWANHGKAAGPIRNRKMLDLKPDLVLAFHADLTNSKGTKDCSNPCRGFTAGRGCGMTRRCMTPPMTRCFPTSTW